ncbi:MAG TPA: NHLP leader peptide family RiPP precursor [Verrucomicrobiaceae bacterium]
MTQKERGKKISDLIAKCWADDTFKKKLMSHTAATLKAEGVDFLANRNVKVHENTDAEYHLVIPPKPVELMEEDLEKVSGGGVCRTDPVKPKPPDCCQCPPSEPWTCAGICVTYK